MNEDYKGDWIQVMMKNYICTKIIL